MSLIAVSNPSYALSPQHLSLHFWSWMLLALCYFSPLSAAHAHPVTFQDGSALFLKYQPKLSGTEFNYSYTPRSALGVTHVRFKRNAHETEHYLIPKWNTLYQRWNKPSSQANIYLSAGMGAFHQEDGDSGGALLGSLQADWESRRYYTQFNADLIQAEGDNDLHHFRARVGVAPSLAAFDEIQTFLIAQVSYLPERAEAFQVGPVLRAFYGRYLFEIGMTQDGEFVGTAMIHF